MNKKLLLAALSAALAAPLAANAGITVYGHLNAELAQETSVIDTNGDGVNNGDDHGGFTVEDNARGRVGIKGSEDLGGGLKGIAQAEWKVDTTQGGKGVGQRVAYAGLKGGFGTFQIGKLKTPYKYFGGVKYDPFVTTNLEARKNGGMSGGSAGKFDGADASSSFGHNSFQSDSLGYISPSWGGLKIWAVLGLDQNGDDRKADDTCSDDDGCNGLAGGGGNYGDYQLGLKYGMKGAVPWEVGFVQNLNASRDDTTAGRGDVVAFKVFGSVGFKTGGLKHKIVLQNEAITESQNAAGASERAEGLLFFGYHLGLGKTTIVAQGSAGVVDYDVPGGEDQAVQYLAVGAVHKFSKKTRVYGGYRSSKWTDYKGVLDAEKAETAITVGIRKDL